jgi:hypothetical protein
MDNQILVDRWHTSIIEECTSILGRPLSSAEVAFVTSRGGFLALEMIQDQVRSLTGNPLELERYLRAGSSNQGG